MGNTARIIWSTVGVTVAAGMLLAAVVWGYAMRPSEEPCQSLQFIITDRAERMYFTEGELTSMLQAEGLYPVGRTIDRSLLHRIEKQVLHHPMVRTAECYLTPRNEVRVRLSQRVPLLRVQTPGDAYLIDTDRRVMEARGTVMDSVLLVTGAVGIQAAAKQIADFAEWLPTDDYWRERIHRLHMQTPQNAIVFVNGQRVMMGPISGYERKLRKLQTFYENSPEEVKEKNYNELDIRFKGQVIGRK
ncbi:MAG: cell division protein FtsQ [Paludibacteraceae bacterium]|nr:cell division protein FtsQ [Paludibacteraceae bacterium]